MADGVLMAQAHPQTDAPTGARGGPAGAAAVAPPGQATDAPPFLDHLREALHGLRAALLDILSEAGADPARPQDVARTFGLNKNLTWKVSKIVTADELLSVVPHVPGQAGIEIFLKAMARAGVGADRITAAAQAAQRYDDVVQLHTDDRSTLEIMVDGALASPQQTEQMRKLAFQGNSAIWGVRARAQLQMSIMMPSQDDPDMVDLAQIGGLVGFRRLRAETRWLLFRRELWDDSDGTPGDDVVEPIDPAGAREAGFSMLTPFCSDPLPEIDVISGPGEFQYELPPGPIGNTAALTCVYGMVLRQVGPRWADRTGECCEVGTTVITPAEHLVLDLLVHRDFEWAMRPELVVTGRLDGSGLQLTERRARNRLSVPETVLDLGAGIGGLTTPIVPGQQAMAAYALERLGLPASDFRSFRVSMAYPPMPIAVLLRSPLPMRPA